MLKTQLPLGGWLLPRFKSYPFPHEPQCSGKETLTPHADKWVTLNPDVYAFNGNFALLTQAEFNPCCFSRATDIKSHAWRVYVPTAAYLSHHLLRYQSKRKPAIPRRLGLCPNLAACSAVLLLQPLPLLFICIQKPWSSDYALKHTLNQLRPVWKHKRSKKEVLSSSVSQAGKGKF